MTRFWPLLVVVGAIALGLEIGSLAAPLVGGIGALGCAAAVFFGSFLVVNEVQKRLSEKSNKHGEMLVSDTYAADIAAALKRQFGDDYAENLMRDASVQKMIRACEDDNIPSQEREVHALAARLMECRRMAGDEFKRFVDTIKG